MDHLEKKNSLFKIKFLKLSLDSFCIKGIIMDSLVEKDLSFKNPNLKHI